MHTVKISPVSMVTWLGIDLLGDRKVLLLLKKKDYFSDEAGAGTLKEDICVSSCL